MLQRLLLATITSISLLGCLLSSPCLAQVERDDDPALIKDVPTYRWQDHQQTPHAVVVAVHGLTMHGAVFDTMARHLAAQGVVVLAPDLRGYGRWPQVTPSDQRDKTGHCEIDYGQSYTDLVDLIKSSNDLYPNLPLFCVGESLGADLVLRAAGDRNCRIDGIILSSPAIKHRSFLFPMIANGRWFLTNPNHPIDLTKYIMKFSSEDPQVVEGALADPLVRKQMSGLEFLRACLTIKPALEYASKVPKSMPVLVIQGSKDRMVKSDAVLTLLRHIQSSDQTIKWLANRGHLLLETSYPSPDTIDTVADWLTMHCKPTDVVQAPETRTHAQIANN